MNALRDIKTASEIEIRLQSNEVLVHVPEDTLVGAVPKGIYDAGYKAGETVWLSADGTWTENGFLPNGWKDALAVSKPDGAVDGLWEIVFKKEKGTWVSNTSKPLELLPQIRDEERG